ncbi:hypothetical protein MVEN_02251600 [Mycena venus]|uniref:Uncharacterized protein n=1 Tax=Mycena venus TaxID=2733690 RepID=A0A8H6X6R7_9AGAR|nr:hypothetical protein MVEN_02251600 [Mycena venus]
MYDKWKVEIRTPGGNKINAERNKVSQARIRLHGLRADYLKNTKVPKGLKLLFSVKATSDNESTSTGHPQALARAQRSQGADQVIQAVEGLMMQDLLDDGKTDSIGSEDSDEDTELSDAASMASFISHDHGASDDEQDDGMYGEDDEQADAMSTEEDAGSGNEPNTAEDGSWDRRTQFAEAYDIDMEKQDLAASIFNNSDGSV